ncbi:hypothetical protein [Acidianus manzaensis]|uniref:hypothetical protein n=1 Tax=Acidianus manzaensis TaxID=282676 RepID=UPI001F18CFDD|nr:hypothetical protein [Acidianus manzaensis]
MQSAYIRKLLAPLILSLFAIGWYKFSLIYLVGSDNLALQHGNYAVYVVPQQMEGYLNATLWLCYFLVFAGLSIFWYNLVKILQQLENGKSKYGIVDLASPIVIALEIIGLITLGNSILGLSLDVRLPAYIAVCSCLMWFWYALVKYVRVTQIAG